LAVLVDFALVSFPLFLRGLGTTFHSVISADANWPLGGSVFPFFLGVISFLFAPKKKGVLLSLYFPRIYLEKDPIETTWLKLALYKGIEGK